jgi:hypothetical protein
LRHVEILLARVKAGRSEQSMFMVGALSEVDAAQALQGLVSSQGVTFTPEALAEVYRVTQGYPYFLQEWGYQSWNLAEHSPIDLALI